MSHIPYLNSTKQIVSSLGHGQKGKRFIITGMGYSETNSMTNNNLWPNFPQTMLFFMLLRFYSAELHPFPE